MKIVYSVLIGLLMMFFYLSMEVMCGGSLVWCNRGRIIVGFVVVNRVLIMKEMF